MTDKDFAITHEKLMELDKTPYHQYLQRAFIEFLKDTDIKGRILDVAERSPLTERMEKEFNIKIDSTSGDLDIEMHTPKIRYDVIICSHVLEHLFNPLFCLEMIKRRMNPDSVLIVATPIKPHWITQSKSHFHEFNKRIFGKLIQRAGLKIVKFKHLYTRGSFSWRSFTGIRPFLYTFHKKVGLFKITK